jgi:hypothetical protein
MDGSFQMGQSQNRHTSVLTPTGVTDSNRGWRAAEIGSQKLHDLAPLWKRPLLQVVLGYCNMSQSGS